MLGIRTRDRRIVGADKSNELWRPSNSGHFSTTFKLKCEEVKMCLKLCQSFWLIDKLFFSLFFRRWRVRATFKKPFVKSLKSQSSPFHFVTVKFETIVRQLCWNLPQRLLANFLRGGRYCCLTCLNSSDLLMAICDKGTTRGKVKFRNRHSLALTVTPIFFALVALSKYESSQVLQPKTISKRYA